MVGPMAGAKVAVRANIAKPVGRARGGRNRMTQVSAKGISTPPVKPCSARKTTISGKFEARPQAAEKNKKRMVLPIR
jgi:hypothetical protein